MDSEDKVVGQVANQAIDVNKVIFLTPEDITDEVIHFMGIPYTYEEFTTMLRFMKQGLFLYKDTVIHTNDAGVEDYKDALIAVRGFAPADNTEDPRYFGMFHSIDQANNYLEAIAFRNVPLVFTITFQDVIVDSIMTMIKKESSDLNKINTIHKIVDSIIQLDRENAFKSFRDIAAIYLQQVFAIIIKKHYCTHCFRFVDSIQKYVLIKNVEDVEELPENVKPSPEPKQSFVYACTQCKYDRRVEPVKVEAINRNSICECGSGRKYKKCCGAKLSPKKLD